MLLCVAAAVSTWVAPPSVTCRPLQPPMRTAEVQLSASAVSLCAAVSLGVALKGASSELFDNRNFRLPTFDRGLEHELDELMEQIERDEFANQLRQREREEEGVQQDVRMRRRCDIALDERSCTKLLLM